MGEVWTILQCLASYRVGLETPGLNLPINFPIPMLCLPKPSPTACPENLVLNYLVASR